jgi:hypothetical protein
MMFDLSDDEIKLVISALHTLIDESSDERLNEQAEALIEKLRNR